MKNLVKKIQDVNAQQNLWQRENVMIVGVSGGPDSMCLLDVLVKIAAKEDLTIIVAHVNYNLRAEDSVRDMQLVKDVADKYGCAFELLECSDVSDGNEEIWRDMRYAFFEKLRKKYSAQVIAVGHNQNDQAETILMHMLRGAGLEGLSGMRFKNTKKVIRPLLGVLREDVLCYCKQNNISYHIDESNESGDFTRNKVRRELLPLLERLFGDNIVTTLSRLGTSAAQDHAFIASTIMPFWEKGSHNAIIFSANSFKSLHISQQRMALRQMINDVRGSVRNIEMGLLEELRKIIYSTKGKNHIFTGKDLKMLRKGDRVELACLQEKDA